MIKMVHFVMCIFPQFKILKNVLITKEKTGEKTRADDNCLLEFWNQLSKLENAGT